MSPPHSTSPAPAAAVPPAGPETTSAPPPRAELFGHPRGLVVLFGTEMWERFSYYGMRALLVLYMVKYLSEPERAERVLGWAELRGALELVTGPLGPQPFASWVYGFYTGLVYLTPLLGGLLADRVLGQRRTVVLGAALMAAGHFMMAFETLLFPALLTLILGNGAFKPNIVTQVGGLYGADDPRRDRAYSIFYVGINIGAFLAPLVCGTLGEQVGWHWGFGAAGVGMLAGLVLYLAGGATLPPDAATRAWAEAQARPETSGLVRHERRAVLAILLLCVPVTLFWATYEQDGNTLMLWIDDHTDRTVSLLGLTVEIPTTWFLAVNPFLIFAFTPVIVELWAWQSRRGREPSTVAKMALGCFGVALANLIMAAAALQAGGGGQTGQTSWLWVLGYFVALTLGELYLSPVGFSLVSAVAPLRHVSLLMAVWLGTSFTGNLLGGALGSLWSGMDKTAFFLMIAAIAAAAGTAIAAFRRPLHALLHTPPANRAADAAPGRPAAGS
ncbi:peptide MFS transporter [Rhodoplanes sp. TEM]|uniref:Peptide MFS transporter n=1 Tax=Rhodoplanes tepidamans TaxID=200616 RepID=A0ABT5J839_RHOTP|nr:MULTISPECIES: peptide MFS transporter [Rhodoplanes]MDC7785556.1 peptide MFS transporter [Rhodoplanes tepidamans]MDC7985245.1 peptide MFS transporter [Rhodoplanes sp. TEM]MDQ0353274.1 POT family proton-dependent oligopeptide transporter [Rhodoplanes tepidamans]